MNSNVKKKPIGLVLPVIIIILIFLVVANYTYIQRENVVRNAEQVTNQMAEYIADNIANVISYGQSSIRLAAVTISQTMTGDTLDKPAELIMPMVENTPFGSIEYIRADGMNVMNIGEPFDASDRMYYIEGIKGNTGIWNNFHPKTSQETLVNFYTPLMYNGKIAGVITGYIEATTQLASQFETQLYGKPIYGVLIDENNMVICSTIQSEYVKDLSLDKFMDRFPISEDNKEKLIATLDKAGDTAVSYKDPSGNGRICMVNVPDSNWKVAIIVPKTSFNAIIYDNTKDCVITIIIIGLILICYAAYVLLRNFKKRKEMALKNIELEEEIHVVDEENHRIFAEISEIRDIIASASMGTWRIELVDGQEPRMYVDNTMKMLLGIENIERTPEMTYTDWFNNIKPEAVPSVLKSVEKMEQGHFDENTYLWLHPVKGERYVRCGGTSQPIEGGYSLRGYHYDVDDVVREDQAKVVMLQEALDTKNEYFSVLEKLGDIFFSLHVIDLEKDAVTEFKARSLVKEIVNHKQGAADMMTSVIGAVTAEEHREAALEFTDLSTIADRMMGKKIMASTFLGTYNGWYLANFVAMDADESGRPTKLIFTTRIIDEEKKQEQRLIKKTQTDELTGLYNRRAYEEDIYEHNDIPDEGDFVYVSLDVNGLKLVNDNLGHTAGDELIIGACQCMKTSLEPYGKLYRIGGDEFVAILLCSAKEAEPILQSFDDTIKNWKGELVDSLSISYGWVSREEEPKASVRMLGAIAEERMYNSKSEHYKKMGVDRRGQKDAHKALCGLYTKILKINIDEDSYQIIDMDMSEQTKEKGFSEHISEWLNAFGTTGQVHPDDLSDYLKAVNLQNMKEYFAGSKTSLHIFYRRKYKDTYKQVMMEIIPANDYSADNQSLFLYVKDIDK